MPAVSAAATARGAALDTLIASVLPLLVAPERGRLLAGFQRFMRSSTARAKLDELVAFTRQEVAA